MRKITKKYILIIILYRNIEKKVKREKKRREREL